MSQQCNFKVVLTICLLLVVGNAQAVMISPTVNLESFQRAVYGAASIQGGNTHTYYDSYSMPTNASMNFYQTYGDEIYYSSLQSTASSYATSHASLYLFGDIVYGSDSYYMEVDASASASAFGTPGTFDCGTVEDPRTCTEFAGSAAGASVVHFITFTITQPHSYIFDAYSTYSGLSFINSTSGESIYILDNNTNGAGDVFLSGILQPGRYLLAGIADVDVSSIAYGEGGEAAATSFSYALTLTPIVVPVPAAAWLFGSGLLGLIGVARRKS